MIFPRLHWVCRSGDKHTERKLRRMCCRGLCTGFWHGREEVGETSSPPPKHTHPTHKGLDALLALQTVQSIAGSPTVDTFRFSLTETFEKKKKRFFFLAQCVKFDGQLRVRESPRGRNICWIIISRFFFNSIEKYEVRQDSRLRVLGLHAASPTR